MSYIRYSIETNIETYVVYVCIYKNAYIVCVGIFNTEGVRREKFWLGDGSEEGMEEDGMWARSIVGIIMHHQEIEETYP